MRLAVVLFFSLFFAPFQLLSIAKEEVPPGVERQGRIPGKGKHKGWEKGKHKGWGKQGEKSGKEGAGKIGKEKAGGRR